MRTRQEIEFKPGVDHVPSGHEGGNLADNYSMPSCDLVDIDRSVKDLFKKAIKYNMERVEGSPSNDPRDPASAASEVQVKVRFVSGERFAINQNELHDKNGQIRLPMISIKRGGIDQSIEDMTGRGINQQTGQLTIKRKLSEKDKDYQNLINKLGLKNNISVASRRTQATLKANGRIMQGGLLDSQIKDNIFEIITMPAPHFITVNYEIAFWAQHFDHMNMMIQRTIQSYLTQGKTFKLTTPKGYWFIATTDDTFQTKDNYDDYTDQEIIRKYTFNIKVKAYLIDGASPTNPNPFRRYISAPFLSFGISEAPGKVFSKSQIKSEQNKFDLAPLNEDERQEPTENEKTVVEITNPFLEYLHMLSSNQKSGETIFQVSNPIAFDIFIK